MAEEITKERLMYLDDELMLFYSEDISEEIMFLNCTDDETRLNFLESNEDYPITGFNHTEKYPKNKRITIIPLIQTSKYDH